MSIWASFRHSPLAPQQQAYLTRALDWGASRSRDFESHWRLWESRMAAGKVSVVSSLHRSAEGLYNALTGGLFLNSARLPLAPQQCVWALEHWDEPIVLQGLVDVTAVIVHESSHALAGFWGSLAELGPYRQEQAYLLQLAVDPKLRQAAQSRLRDLAQDAWECEKIRLE